jgi:hypothetical protein
VESSRRVAPIVFGVVVAVVAVWITVVVANRRGPEETVEDYLTAIVGKDVDGALALVTRYGYGVPYGVPATFLTPEAIADDWWVVSVEETGRELGDARVRAVIAGPDGTASGEFTVTEDDDEWLLEDPFARVRFPLSPLGYIQVNDKIVPRPPDAGAYGTYALFPGTYRFFQTIPGVVTTGEAKAVAAFPPADGNREKEVLPPSPAVGDQATAKAQKAVARKLDECAGYATELPYGNCPFGTDGEVDTPDGKRVRDLHGLKWTVTTYPKVALAYTHPTGFSLETEEAGKVTLTGTGLDTDDNPATFTVTCDVDLSTLSATLTPEGDVELGLSPHGPAIPFNTCRRNA